MRYAVVVPWHRKEEVQAFREAWRVGMRVPRWLVLQHDERREGCGVTKNRGVAEAMSRGADVVVVLDGDCYPVNGGLAALAEAHVKALEPQPVGMFEVVTDPPSRGTPYGELTVTMPVAASMGFWTEVGDYCGVRQLAHAAGPMTFRPAAVHGRYFPLCGMNVAFRPAEWGPWCRFIDVPRFDDIWMGWLWQREAYWRGYCFNLAGPLVRHSRQSDVWRNLREEAVHLEASETLWRRIATHPNGDYAALVSLLPVSAGTPASALAAAPAVGRRSKSDTARSGGGRG
jgi:hypothetical protein